MTEVNLVLKVVDKITADTQRIIGRFIPSMKRAAQATKDFFAKFEMETFGKVLKGFEKIGKAVGALAGKIVELAPNAQTFEATFGPATQEKINATASSINKVGAAWETFVGSLVNRGPNAVGILDDLARRLKDAAGIGPVLTERAALQEKIYKAEEAFTNSVFRERGEFDKLTKAITDAKAALVAYDSAQQQKSANEARTREAQDRALEQRIRQQNQARGFEGVSSGAQVDEYGRRIDEAARALRDLQQMTAATETEVVGRMLDEWIEYNSERINVAQDALDDISEDELEFAATMERIRQDDIAQEQAHAEERIRLAQESYARELELANNQRVREADEWRAWFERRREENEKIWETASRVAEDLTGRFMATFDAIIAGTDSVGRAFTKMVGGIIADVGRMMASEAIKKFLTSIVGSFLGGTTGDYSTQNGGAFDEFGGEISPLYDGAAGGGNLAGGRLARVGERGSELFVPNTAGNVITASRAGSMGGASIGAVTINVNGAQDPGRTAREVKSALLSLMQSDPATRQRMRVVASGGGVA